MDMSATVAPRSDQLNSDDLIAGPRKITITSVSGTGNPDQPVGVFFDGDGGKPYKPCKSMRRVMIAAWGADASQYVGRSMTIYRDPKVVFGGMEVGGVRISHMSHIQRDMVMALTASKAKRTPYTVKVLAAEATAPAQAGFDRATQVATALVDRVQSAHDTDALKEITGDETVVKQRAWLTEKRPELALKVDEAVQAQLSAMEGAAA